MHDHQRAPVAYRGGRSGGNVGLKGAAGPFTVSVLQTFDPGTSEQTIERVESLWKDNLGARLVGYNRNWLMTER